MRVWIPSLKGSPISKALTCMRVYKSVQTKMIKNGNFVKESDTSSYIVV